MVSDTSSAKRNQKDSPLLRLPAELRDKIYAHVFDTLNVDIGSHGKREGGRVHTSLLAACRQTNDEAAIYKNSFSHIVISDSCYWRNV